MKKKRFYFTWRFHFHHYYMPVIDSKNYKYSTCSPTVSASGSREVPCIEGTGQGNWVDGQLPLLFVYVDTRVWEYS